MVADPPYITISACRICRRQSLEPVFDLGEQALSGRFPTKDESDPPKVPLSLVRCTGCGLVQLEQSVQTSELYGQGYGYRSDINETMRGHLSSIAEAVETRVDLKAGDVVLDIGCNDGTLLKSYRTPGLRRLGIDPIADIFRQSYPDDIRVLTAFFEPNTFERLNPNGQAKAITSIAMFYDLEDPSSFVAEIKRILDPMGIWVLEQSYLPAMLDQNGFDTICHEHLEYYDLRLIERLAEEHDLKVIDVSLNDINGGSFQISVCHAGALYTPNTAALSALRNSERDYQLDTDAPYADFRTRIAALSSQLVSFITSEAAAGKQIFVYGASTKGNVLLQYFGLDHSLLRGCADRNPRKWGCRTPGTNIPIVSEEEARNVADHFLVLPWHFEKEFIARERDFIDRGGSLIFPLPNLKIVRRDDAQ